MRLIGFSIMSYTVLITSLSYFHEVSYKAVAYAMIPCALSALTRRYPNSVSKHKLIFRNAATHKFNIQSLHPLNRVGTIINNPDLDYATTTEGIDVFDDDARDSFMTAYAVMTSVLAAFILKECDKAQCAI